MTIRNTEEFQAALKDFLIVKVLEFTKTWEGVEKTPVPPPSQYVVRAETPDGPLYLRSLTGSCSEWTSEQRYAKRYDKIESKWVAEDAFCPDATSFSVRRLTRSPGYHITFRSKWDGTISYVNAVSIADTVYTDDGKYRKIFASRDAADAWIDERINLSFTCKERNRWTVVPESPESPALPVPGSAAQ